MDSVVVDKLIEYIAKFLALILVLPIHELAHGFIAMLFGDRTAKNCGRLSLNPLVHFDPLGLIFFILAGFGWAKPVPINPDNFKKRKTGIFFVSIAGVSANYLTAFLMFPLWILSFKIIDSIGYFSIVLNYFLYYSVIFSLVFFVFNLLPFYPLDGFNAIFAFSKKRGHVYRFLRTYGIYILDIFILLGIIADYADLPQIDLLGRLINYCVSYLEIPIMKFWGLVLYG